ncbi:hypothetical protein LTR91_024716 [Friedmanniomyces endolithicus]|uniref:tripeptidyl-peptidase II n=1 Tax=Friedmanniomyces endolithicus TaxID=329885 RepID=A0AAN6H474_9PEZI|nr:hypothetical protein LTR75_016602 [Friedmanniomyces endolithicus]KAK0825796.1 hypothetical protein LTR03_017359 [Friedmanniomyces endolithicus]KAK0843664.1 hypothetical protein LTS02_016015 [Friedmanniomyces endolithicus]KAK0869276.1 hypothetical protein LTR87_013787 [Friedmanniomyces endolithicus]KAK0896000.1 hypothetical protein LTR02_011473 [Friedmanniomyces endolithicus]
MVLFTAAALLLLAACTSGAVPDGYQLHEARSLAASSLIKRQSTLRPDAVIPIKIGLTQQGLDVGISRLMNISHPASAAYGKHLSVHEVNDIFSPSGETVAAVKKWLANATNIDKTTIHISKNGWLLAHVPVHAAERAFATHYYEYEDRDGHLRLGCDAYYIPSHLQSHIDYVTPGVKSSPPLRKRMENGRGPPGGRPGRQPLHWEPPYHGPWHKPPGAHHLPPDLQNCGLNITPPCIRALYGIPEAHLNDSVNDLGFYEAGDYYAQSDLNAFFSQFAPNIPNGTAPIPAFIDGAQAPVAADDPTNTGESDVDLDMAFSLIYPQSIVLYQTDDKPQANLTGYGVLAGEFNTFLDALDGSYCNYTYEGLSGDSPGIDPVYPDPLPGGYNGSLQCGVYLPTRVISISYGSAEADLPTRYQRRQCNEYMKLVLQGHTIVEASGDYGVGSFPGDGTPSGCLSGSGQNQTIYNPDALSSCPWILSVGGTQLEPNQTVLDPESVMQDNLTGAPLFSSHGGFSNYHERPAYQKAAVDAYFANHDPGLPYYVANANATNVGANGGIYNRAGRAFPDVSANGAHFQVYRNSTLIGLYGTSLAAPLFASVITLINQQRTLIGKRPVGFINPVLYQNPGVLNDITNGSNPNCGSSGFPAVKGWDPSTGLGTPNYPKMLELFLSLP